MTREEFQTFHKWMTDNGRDLCRKKSEDYAKDEDVMQNFKLCEVMDICSVETGFLVRLCDKFQRLVNVIRDGNSVEDETEFDTLLDEINYRILLAAWRKERAEKEKVDQLELPGDWPEYNEYCNSLTKERVRTDQVLYDSLSPPSGPPKHKVYFQKSEATSDDEGVFETQMEEAQRIAKEIAGS